MPVFRGLAGGFIKNFVARHVEDASISSASAVKFVKKLGEIDIEGTGEFSCGKTYLKDMRQDSVTINDATDDILKNTKSKNQNFFTVPKIVE